MDAPERLQRHSAVTTREAGLRLLRTSAGHALAADLLALEGLDLADLYQPSAGDALVLRGEG